MPWLRPFVLLCLFARLAAAEAPRGSLAVLAGAPVSVSDGIALGGAMEVHRSLQGPFVAGVRASVTTVADASVRWQFREIDAIAAISGGAETSLGSATVWLIASAGVLGARVSAVRQQAERLATAGSGDLRRTSLGAGPWVGLEAGVAVPFSESFALVLAGGPTWTRQRVGGADVNRPGIDLRLGVSHAF